MADQLKIIDNKIKVNQAQYDLDRLTAEISAYTSGDLKSLKMRLKMIWYIILITFFTNTDWVNFLKYHQLNLNLIS